MWERDGTDGWVAPSITRLLLIIDGGGLRTGTVFFYGEIHVVFGRRGEIHEVFAVVFFEYPFGICRRRALLEDSHGENVV